MKGIKRNERKSKYQNTAFKLLLLGCRQFGFSAQRSIQLIASYCTCASPSSEVSTLTSKLYGTK